MARRVVQHNLVVLDQVDFFEVDGFTRIVGLLPDALVSQIFYNNSAQTWPLVSGEAISDAQVTAGQVYFHEISGQPGFYNVRFRPDAVGYWRNLLSYSVVKQRFAQDFDVVQSTPVVGYGIHANFSRSCAGDSCVRVPSLVSQVAYNRSAQSRPLMFGCSDPNTQVTAVVQSTPPMMGNFSKPNTRTVGPGSLVSQVPMIGSGIRAHFSKPGGGNGSC